MKILFHGDNLPDQEMCEQLGINVEKQVNSDMSDVNSSSYVVTFPEDVKIVKGAVKTESLREDSLFPRLSQYVAGNDDSLSDFIMYKGRIISTGNFVSIDTNPIGSHDYECSGAMRFLNDSYFNAVNFTLAGENSIEGYYEFLDKMLVSSEKQKGTPHK